MFDCISTFPGEIYADLVLLMNEKCVVFRDVIDVTSSDSQPIEPPDYHDRHRVFWYVVLWRMFMCTCRYMVNAFAVSMYADLTCLSTCLTCAHW